MNNSHCKYKTVQLRISCRRSQSNPNAIRCKKCGTIQHTLGIHINHIPRWRQMNTSKKDMKFGGETEIDFDRRRVDRQRQLRTDRWRQLKRLAFCRRLTLRSPAGRLAEGRRGSRVVPFRPRPASMSDTPRTEWSRGSSGWSARL